MNLNFLYYAIPILTAFLYPQSLSASQQLTKENCLNSKAIVEDPFIETPLKGRCEWLPYDSPGSSFTDPKHHDPRHFQYIAFVPSLSDELAPHLIGETPFLANVINEHTFSLPKCHLILYLAPEKIFASKKGAITISPPLTTELLHEHGFDEAMSDEVILKKIDGDEEALTMMRSVFKGGNGIPYQLNKLYKTLGIASPAHFTAYNELVIYNGSKKRDATFHFDAVACTHEAEDFYDKQDFASERKIPFIVLGPESKHSKKGQKESSEISLSNSLPTESGNRFDPFSDSSEKKYYKKVNIDLTKANGKTNNNLSYSFENRSIDSQKSTVRFVTIANSKGQKIDLVVKKFPKTSWLIDDFKTYAKMPNHPNIIRFFGGMSVFVMGFRNDFLIFEKMEGDLNTLDARYSDHLFEVIAKALDFLHERGLTHNDIKPSNILYKNNLFKLADFSQKNGGDFIASRFVGTPKNDIAALGLTLFGIKNCCNGKINPENFLLDLILDLEERTGMSGEHATQMAIEMIFSEQYRPKDQIDELIADMSIGRIDSMKDVLTRLKGITNQIMKTKKTTKEDL